MILVEVATYPEERVVQQIQDDIRLVRQARGVLPEAVVLCLCPRGEDRVPQDAKAGLRNIRMLKRSHRPCVSSTGEREWS